MLGLLQHLGGVAVFDDAALVEHGYLVAEVLHDGQVVADEDEAEVQAGL